MKVTKGMIWLWRMRNGKTQEQLGDMLNLSGAQICRMEKGERRITKRTEQDLLRLCKGIDKLDTIRKKR